MTKLQALEQSIRELDGEDFAAFAQWFEQLQAERFDRRIEADAKSGVLDGFADKALTDFRRGKSRAL